MNVWGYTVILPGDLTNATINVEGRGLGFFFHSTLLPIAKLMFLLMNESRGANNVFIVSFCSII